MIYLYNYFTPKYFYLFLIIVFVILFLIIFIKKNIYHKLTLEKYQESPHLLLDYLDKYYIKNKYVTFSLVIFYILLKVGLILYIRYIYLGYEFKISKILLETQTLSFIIILKILMVIILLIISVKLFYFLLYKVFFDEMLKVYIYCMKNKTLFIMKHKLFIFSAKDIWGPCYLFFECVYRKTPEPNEFYYNVYYNHDYIYKNKSIKKITLIMIKLSQKYYFIFWFIQFSRKLCHVLYVHFNKENIFRYLPSFLLIIIFMYDFFNSNIYYTYYMLVVYYFLNLYYNWYNFIQQFDPIFIGGIKAYFYDNNDEYAKKRLFIIENPNSNIKYNGKEFLLHILNNKEMIQHIYHDFKKENENDLKMNLMTLRFYTIILLSILNSYLLYLIITNDITFSCSLIVIIILITIIWLITIFFGKNTYSLEKENPEDNTYPTYVYNKRYELIFWLLIIIQIYIFWKLLVKPEIFLMNSEVLLQLPFNILKITKIYDVEDKTMYIFQYFEKNLNKIDSASHDYLRHILRQIDFNSLISLNNNLTLNDLQVYIKLLLDNQVLLEIFQHLCNIFYLEDIEQQFIQEIIDQHNFEKDFGHILFVMLFIDYYLKGLIKKGIPRRLLINLIKRLLKYLS